MIIASHSDRAHRTIERDVQIVHHRLERLCLAVGAGKRQKSAHRHEHDDREKTDCLDSNTHLILSRRLDDYPRALLALVGIYRARHFAAIAGADARVGLWPFE